jgi:hypothetical protein
MQENTLMEKPMRRKRKYQRHCEVHRNHRRTMVTLKKKAKRLERDGKDSTHVRRKLDAISCLMKTA